MADINVERKGTSIWPWIIGLLVAALLIWALMGLFGDDDADVDTVDPAVETNTGQAATPATPPPAGTN